jgi:hypothetical protein
MVDVLILLRAMIGHGLLDKISNNDVRTQLNAKNLGQTLEEQRERERERPYPRTATL